MSDNKVLIARLRELLRRTDEVAHEFGERHYPGEAEFRYTFAYSYLAQGVKDIARDLEGL